MVKKSSLSVQEQCVVIKKSQFVSYNALIDICHVSRKGIVKMANGATPCATKSWRLVHPYCFRLRCMISYFARYGCARNLDQVPALYKDKLNRHISIQYVIRSYNGLNCHHNHVLGCWDSWGHPATQKYSLKLLDIFFDPRMQCSQCKSFQVVFTIHSRTRRDLEMKYARIESENLECEAHRSTTQESMYDNIDFKRHLFSPMFPTVAMHPTSGYRILQEVNIGVFDLELNFKNK